MQEVGENLYRICRPLQGLRNVDGFTQGSRPVLEYAAPPGLETNPCEIMSGYQKLRSFGFTVSSGNGLAGEMPGLETSPF